MFHNKTKIGDYLETIMFSFQEKLCRSIFCSDYEEDFYVVFTIKIGGCAGTSEEENIFS